MDKQELKKIAERILIDTAIYNYQFGLTVEANDRNLSDEEYVELAKLVETAKVSVTWDD